MQGIEEFKEWPLRDTQNAPDRLDDQGRKICKPFD